MNRDWPAEAHAYALTLTRAIDDHGGVDLARRAEASPDVRTQQITSLLTEVGLLDLDAFASSDESAAAALAVKAAGSRLLPYPLTHVLSVTPDVRSQAGAVYLFIDRAHAFEHLDLVDSPAAVKLGTGELYSIEEFSPAGGTPLDPFGFVVDRVAKTSRVADQCIPMHLVLDALWTCGALETAVSAATSYATARRQFGKPIGSYGEIRWRLADMAVSRTGLDELARFTWWLVNSGRATEADVLALRLAALESASTILSNAHQVFGAIGLCEEHDMTIIDRHLQAALHRPTGTQRTVRLLSEAIARSGFSGLYDIAAQETR